MPIGIINIHPEGKHKSHDRHVMDEFGQVRQHRLTGSAMDDVASLVLVPAATAAKFKLS